MKKLIASVLLGWSINILAMSSLTASGALVGLVGAVAFVVGAPVILSAAIASIGLHAMGMGIILDSDSTSTPQGLPAPVNPDGGSPKGAEGSPTNPMIIDLGKPPVGKRPQIDGWKDNPKTPKESFTFPLNVPGAGTKYPSAKSATEALVEFYVANENPKYPARPYSACGQLVCGVDAQGNKSSFSPMAAWGNLQTLTECANGYTLTAANECTLDLSDKEPKFIKKPDGGFEPHPKATPTNPTKPTPKLSPDGKNIQNIKDGEGVIIHHNDDGTVTITNLKNTENGGQAGAVYQVKDGEIIDSGLIANESGLNDLNATNTGLTKGEPIGVGTGTGSTGSTGGTGTGNASGAASGVSGCGSSKSPCVIDDSGFSGGKATAINVVGQLQGTADKSDNDQLSLLDNATKNSLGMTSSWFPSLLPSASRLDCKLMPISTAIVRGDINLTAASNIDVCSKLNVAREIMHWLFYVITVFAIFRIFVNSNKAAI